MKDAIASLVIGFLTTLPAFSAEGIDYVRDVKPILAQHCYGCHGQRQQKAELRLDTAAAIKAGGASGPAIVSGSSSQSLLVKSLLAAEGVTAMPYKKPRLPGEKIEIIKRWIDTGAAAPANEVVDAQLARRFSHWAFEPPGRVTLPHVKDSHWVRNGIDLFILARLEKEGLRPSQEADRVTLIRRLSLDLLGLPPSPAEVKQFLDDQRPDAYELLVERLLATPHFGERWGRLWLDVARYADSNGYSIDGPREIWKYREWVIGALNRDLPFDQFTIEQIAGDMLPGATLEQQIATGFHRNTPINQEGGIDREQFRIESVYDRVHTTGAAFLGLTLGCARCHDHKFDPITQREFFQLFAFLNNADEPNLDLATPELVARRDAIRGQVRALEEELNTYLIEKVKSLEGAEKNTIKPEITSILNLGVEQRDEKQKQALVAFFQKSDLAVRERATTIAELKKRLPKFPTTMVMKERARPRETTIHIMGDFTRKGAAVTPGVPGVLHPLPDAKRLDRLTLGRWLVDRRNPLTARVTVNRAWQTLFGKGLVETENDFGTQGTPPSHPELLDWLAAEFMDREWSLKSMIRLITHSATYRQSSHLTTELEEKDPYNRLLARQSRFRLDAELVRDASLVVSGKLTKTIGGPSVFPPQPDGVYRFTQIQKTWDTSTGPERYRRGLYVHFWRSAPYPTLTAFDAPDGVNACTRRNRSNTPLQALTLLNDEAFLELARALASRLLSEGPPDARGKIDLGFRICVGRAPADAELSRVERYLEEQVQEFRKSPKDAELSAPADAVPAGDRPTVAAWTAVARVLMNLDEFITRE